MSSVFPAAAASSAGMANHSRLPRFDQDVAILSQTHAEANSRGYKS